MSAVLQGLEPSPKCLAHIQQESPCSLVQHFDLIARADDGVARLRELILTLAVRGKLIPQSPEDEPAEVLLEKSRNAMSRLMQEGKIKKEKLAVKIDVEEMPFQIPESWSWARLTDTGAYINGLTFKPEDWHPTGIPIIRIQNLSGRSADFNRTQGSFDAAVIVKPGDILVSWSATLDTFIWEGETGVLNQHIFRVEPAPSVDKKYLYWMLKWAIKDLAQSEHAHGLVMTHINRGPFLAKPIPLPPLAEQARIATRVEELMQLCDAVEAQNRLEADGHSKLINALLGTLVQSETPEVLAENWQRVASHFDMLLDRPEAVDALEQTILQLAVRGLLVPQDLKDESASALLRRIRVDKDRMIKDGMIKGDKPLPSITEEKKPFDLPHGWEWSPLGALLENQREISYGVIKLGVEPQTGGIPTLRCSDVKPGWVNLSGVRKVSEEIESEYARTRLRGGEILLNIRGTLGGVALTSDALAGYNVAREVAVIPIDRCLHGEFFMHVMLSQYFWQAIQNDLRGIAYKGLNLGSLRTFPIPIPPLAEQSRIVTRIKELKALCAELRATLSKQQSIAVNLSRALIEEV